MQIPTRNKNKFIEEPHIVILGAGASRAAFPNGDISGKKLPLMADFVEVLGLEQTLSKLDLHLKKGENFEENYTRWHNIENKSKLKILNEAIYKYFSSMKLPEEVTIYDELILSLRDKDLIATFNWDPLLTQALVRNVNAPGKRPHIAYLHGNVAIAACDKCEVMDYSIPRLQCHKCGEFMTDVPLLYPIGQKDYAENPFIKTQWNVVKTCLENSYIVTIFGYSAPNSDLEAKSLLQNAHNNNLLNEIGSFEIIDRPDCNKDEVSDKWKEFKKYDIHAFVTGNYRRSQIFRHPRRSCEALYEASMQQNPMPENDLPKFSKLIDLHDCILSLTEKEYMKT